MKKNAIAHMTAEKESVGKRISRFHPVSRILCLLLALIIWLAVVNLTGSTADSCDPGASESETEKQ